MGRIRSKKSLRILIVILLLTGSAFLPKAIATTGAEYLEFSEKYRAGKRAQTLFKQQQQNRMRTLEQDAARQAEAAQCIKTCYREGPERSPIPMIDRRDCLQNCEIIDDIMSKKTTPQQQD